MAASPWQWKKVSVFLVGMVVFRGGIRTVATPPSISTIKDKGDTSQQDDTFTSPARTPACTAAPAAITSSGFTLWLGFLPPTSLARDKLCSMCLGRVASAVTKGREILASCTPDNSILAFSAAR